MYHSIYLLIWALTHVDKYKALLIRLAILIEFLVSYHEEIALSSLVASFVRSYKSAL